MKNILAGVIITIIGFIIFSSDDIHIAILGIGFQFIGAILIGWNGESLWRKYKLKKK